MVQNIRIRTDAYIHWYFNSVYGRVGAFIESGLAVWDGGAKTQSFENYSVKER
jgi:hypothetical protein